MKNDILVVDDSLVVRKVLQRALKQAELPVEVVEASNGVEALDQLRTHKIKMVLCDVHMPSMDGLELLRRMKADPELKSVPVLMVSRETSATVVLEALQLGAVGYVRIPFTPDQIKEKMLALL